MQLDFLKILFNTFYLLLEANNLSFPIFSGLLVLSSLRFIVFLKLLITFINIRNFWLSLLDDYVQALIVFLELGNLTIQLLDFIHSWQLFILIGSFLLIEFSLLFIHLSDFNSPYLQLALSCLQGLVLCP